MNQMKKHLLALSAALVMLSVLAVPALAAEADAAPAPTGIAVQLDGQNVAFTDATPEVVDQRTFLPFRAVFEAMGAEVDWKQETATVVARRGDVQLEMALGSRQATVTEGEENRTIEMDVAAYAKNGRTYVPVRFAAEAFGCNVGWDQDDQTVIIADVEKLMGDATFELMDRYAADQAADAGNQAVTGSLSMKLEIGSGSDKLSMPVTGTVDGIGSDTAAQVKVNMDLSGLMELSEAETEEEAAAQAALAEALKNVACEVRMDLDSGICYLNLPLMAELYGTEENVWYLMDLQQIMAEVGMDWTQLMQNVNKQSDTKTALLAVLRAVPLDDKDSGYEALAAAGKLYVEMMGDQAFTRKNGGYTANVTLEDMGTIQITIKEQNGVLTGMDMTMHMAETAEGQTVEMEVTVAVRGDRVTMTMTMDMADALALEFSMDLSGVATEQKPETAPPAGAQVIDLIGGAFGDTDIIVDTEVTVDTNAA